MKKHLIKAAIPAAVCLLVLCGVVSADYIGPNRTVMVTRDVTVITEIATGWWMCSVISYPPDFSAIGCSVSEFNYYRSHPGQYSFSDGVITDTVTYPPATVSGVFVCGNPGNNGWCTGGAGIALSGSEPVSGYTITSIESAFGELCRVTILRLDAAGRGRDALLLGALLLR